MSEFPLNYCALLAPGPSMSLGLADFVQPILRTGAINNSFILAPWAEFLVANDSKWWNQHPASQYFAGRKFSANRVAGVSLVTAPGISTETNSGVLGLEVAKQLGMENILLLGFDMSGSHFFGEYTNECRNTPAHVRKLHMGQYEKWRDENKNIRVINCTPGSLLDMFERGSIYDFAGLKA